MTEFTVTRTYKVRISDADVLNVLRWAAASALNGDRVLRDLTETATQASDVGDQSGLLFLYLQDRSALGSYYWIDDRLETIEPIMQVEYDVDHPSA